MAKKKPLSKGAAKKAYNGLRTFKRDYVLSQGAVTPLEKALDDAINALHKFITEE